METAAAEEAGDKSRTLLTSSEVELMETFLLFPFQGG